jgi:hypothetical protein
MLFDQKCYDPKSFVTLSILTGGGLAMEFDDVCFDDACFSIGSPNQGGGINSAWLKQYFLERASENILADIQEEEELTVL